MTKEEAKKRGDEKVAELNRVMQSLGLRIEAHQVVTQNGIIKTEIFFIDMERYDLQVPVTETKEDEPKKDIQKDN